jgi:hypothetical protein
LTSHQVREEWRQEVERSLKKINQLGSANGMIARHFFCAPKQSSSFETEKSCRFDVLVFTISELLQDQRCGCTFRTAPALCNVCLF